MRGWWATRVESGWASQTAGHETVLEWLARLKTIYLITVATTAAVWSSFDGHMFALVNCRWPREGGPVFASHFATWDTAHYLYLSEVGYAKDMPSCAFYPLWPLLMRVTAPLVGGSHLLAGLILANACSLAAWVLFHRMVARRWGVEAATWSLAFLIAFPGALFFQFVYTEGLFLLLAVLLWWGLDEQRYGWAGAAAVLLPLTRGVGVFMVLPIAFHALSVAPPAWFERFRTRTAEWWARQRHWWLKTGGLSRTTEESQGSQVRSPHRDEAGRFPWAPWALLAAPVAGWGAYLVLMWHWTGNPFEGFEAQKYWGVHSISNLWDVPKFVAGCFSPTAWHEFRGSVLDRCVFVLVLYRLPVLWRLDRSLLVWTYVLGILPAMSGTFTSYTRFASCAFPVFIALGAVLARPGLRQFRYALLAVFSVLQVVLVWRFVNFRWAG